MLAVSPSPETARKLRPLFTKLAPVVTEGIRPWTVLKPWLFPRKYAGVFEEHPIPLIFAIFSGEIPFSHAAWIMLFEIWSCPHPGQSEDLLPVYSDLSSSRTLSFTITSPPELLESYQNTPLPLVACRHCRKRCVSLVSTQRETPFGLYRIAARPD